MGRTATNLTQQAQQPVAKSLQCFAAMWSLSLTAPLPRVGQTNDSGSSLYYQSGKAVTGTKTISNVAYTFNSCGETIRKTATAGATTNPTLPTDDKKYTIYTVQKGDSFWRIANKVGSTIAELEQLNGKSRNDIIYTGKVLKVPQK